MLEKYANMQNLHCKQEIIVSKKVYTVFTPLDFLSQNFERIKFPFVANFVSLSAVMLFARS